MVVWYFDIMYGMALLGVALFTGICVVITPALREVRLMGLVTAYALGAWMLYVLPLPVTLATWSVFAAFGGALAFVYELWARHRYAGTGRVPRPLAMLKGFVLWPAMIPEAIEGALVDFGVLAPSRPDAPESTGSDVPQQRE